MNKRTLTTGLATTLSAALLMQGAASAQTASGEEEVKPWVGALYPDTPLAQGHNDAARALATVDDNPLIRWTYRVWCETGYHNINNVGTGQVADVLPDPKRDLISPNGFYYRAGQVADLYQATGRGEYDRLMPEGGVQFMDNAWYFGTNDLGSVIVQLDNGDLLMFDALTTPEDMQAQVLDQMPAAGLDPSRITHIFVGHSHADHYGGVNLLRREHAPDAIVVAGAPDAELMRSERQAVLDGTAPLDDDLGENPTPEAIEEARARAIEILPESIDLEVPAHEGFTSGLLRIPVGEGQDVVAILNPGHTVGQISVIVPVSRDGEDHKLLVWSGNDQIAEAPLYARSTDFARVVAEQEGADVWFNTHPYQQALFHWLRQIHADPTAENPMIMGTNGVSRLLGVFADCQRAGAQRFEDGTWVSWE